MWVYYLRISALWIPIPKTRQHQWPLANSQYQATCNENPPCLCQRMQSLRRPSCLLHPSVDVDTLYVGVTKINLEAWWHHVHNVRDVQLSGPWTAYRWLWVRLASLCYNFFCYWFDMPLVERLLWDNNYCNKSGRSNSCLVHMYFIRFACRWSTSRDTPY